MKTSLIKRAAFFSILWLLACAFPNKVYAQSSDREFVIVNFHAGQMNYFSLAANGTITNSNSFDPMQHIWRFITNGERTVLWNAQGFYVAANGNKITTTTDISQAVTVVLHESVHKIECPSLGFLRYSNNWTFNGSSGAQGTETTYEVVTTSYDDEITDANIVEPSGDLFGEGDYPFTHTNAEGHVEYNHYHFLDDDQPTGFVVNHYYYKTNGVWGDHATPPAGMTFSYTWTLGNEAQGYATVNSSTGVVTLTNRPIDDYVFTTLSLSVASQAPFAGYTDNDQITLRLVPPMWKNMVTSLPIDGGYNPQGDEIIISTNNGLAWLISVVNGYNGCTANDLSGKTVRMTSDVDMEAYIWTPIGENGNPFKGTFDGGGYEITGLHCQLTGQESTGLFATVDAGEVKNTFVAGCNFIYKGNHEGHIGIIADTITNNAVLHSSEAVGQLTAVNDNLLAMGGLVGLAYNNANVHSSMSMATLNGYNMGGAVGEIRNGSSLKNSFTHALYTSTNDAAGLAYMNAGAIDNCYVRVRSGNTLANMFVTEETGTVSNVYYPEGQTSSTGATYTTTVTPYYYKHADNRVGSTPLLQLLNANRGTGAEWMRTSAGTGNSRGTNSSINDDYPVLKLNDFNSLASSDGIVLRYGDINDLLASFTASTDAIDLYRSKAGVNSNSSSSANLYINEDVALTSDGTVNAFVGITSDNSAGTNGANPNGLTANGLTDAIDWHMFSTPLANAPLGVNYNNDDNQYPFQYGHVEGMPAYSFYTESEHDGYFPSKTYGTDADYYEDWDFYCFYEPDYHWINFKRNTPSHWHEDAPHDHIEYTNETNLVSGKGYLVSSKKETYLQSYGSLNSGNVTIPVAKGAEHCTGYNLLGNPYQSYLDFKAFAEANSGTGKIWNDVSNASYILMDEDNGGYVTYAYDQTWTETSAPRYINMHQGFFVVADNATNAEFTPEMCSVEHGGSGFRGDDEEPAYPLVTLCLNESNGNKSYVTVELDRPSKGGALLASDLHIGTGMLYARYDNADYSVVFAQPGTTSMPVWFESLADNQYTLTWSTRNGTFSNLHLIDNLTGVDIDMNACSEYRFTASTKDYKSRFKLMFTYTDVEENIDADHAGTFAFMMGGNLVVNGEGRLEVIDMNGRIISATELNGAQNTVALPNASQGLYMLRLTSGNGVRVQKIVVR